MTGQHHFLLHIDFLSFFLSFPLTNAKGSLLLTQNTGIIYFTVSFEYDECYSRLCFHNKRLIVNQSIQVQWIILHAASSCQIL